VSTNRLGILPTGIGMCTELSNFEFHSNPFGSIPGEVIKAGAAVLIDYLKRFFKAGPPPGCEKLPGAWLGKSKVLDLEGFFLYELPPYVYGLGYVEALLLKRNNISQLLPEVSLLRNMQRLDLESNQLRTLPLELCLCPLVELNLALNNLEEPPLEVRERGCEVILRYLKAQYHAKKVGILDIRHCFLTSLPPEIQRLAGPALHTMDMSDNLMPQLPNLRLLCYTKELRIGNNLLSHLPESIRLLSSLTSLHVHQNQLTTLPVTFVHLTALLVLNMDDNRLPSLPAVVCRVTSLTSLSISNNRIPVLDAEVGQLKQLKELRVCGNGLQAVADELCDAVELRLLDLSNNNLELLPGGICTPGHMERLSNLRCLDVTGNLLSVLPSGLGLLATTLEDLMYDDYELSQLPSEVLEEGETAVLHYLSVVHATLDSKCLDLTAKGLQSVPRHIGEMMHLEELRLSQNHLVDLPEWIGQLKALRVLRIDGTGIRWLPFGLADCASLQMLDLDGLALFAPPKQIISKGVPIIKEWLGRLREARGGHRLDLSSLGLEDWPAELSSNTKEGMYDSLQRLNLLDNILTELPVEVCALSSLTELTAGYNRLAEIHPRVGVLVNMKTLHLPFNNLTGLPESISLIQSLRSVNLDGNQIKELPDCLCVVTGLQELRLNQNKLSGLPGAIAKLVMLQSLELCYNELGSLPRTIGFNSSLRSLKVSYNALVSVPPELGILTLLEDLQLTHNQLSVLPAELGALLPPKGKLTVLGLTANYFKAPLSQIIMRGTPATLRFLREQIPVK
jgi:leucine-rich repeat protein SHOC2